MLFREAVSLRRVNTTMIDVAYIVSTSSSWSLVARACECDIVWQKSQIYLFIANVYNDRNRRRNKLNCDRCGLHGGLINMGCAPSLPLRSHTRGSRQSSTASLPNNASLATDNCQQQHKDNDVTTSSLHIVFTPNDRTPNVYLLLCLSIRLWNSNSVSRLVITLICILFSRLFLLKLYIRLKIVSNILSDSHYIIILSILECNSSWHPKVYILIFRSLGLLRSVLFNSLAHMKIRKKTDNG